MDQAPDDFQFAFHPTRKGLDGLEHFAFDAQYRSQLLYLLFVFAGHEREGRPERVKTIHNGVKAHVLFGCEVHVEAGVLEYDAQVAAYHAWLAHNIMPGDKHS